MLQLWPLLRNLLIISAAITLPLLAIAAVTGTFVRYMLSVLAGVIYLVTVAVVVAMTMEDKADAPYMDYVQAGCWW